MRLLSACCVGDDDFTIFLRMACILLKILGNLTIQAVLAFSAVLHCFPRVLSDLWWLLALAVQCHQRRQRQWHPTPVLLPGKSHGRRNLVGYSSWGREESDTFMHWRRKWQPTPVFLPGESQGREPGGLPSMGSHRVGHN